ncbi:MAG: YhcH/YjgK/YiaL family protein [Bacteroidales bacterium]|nr:YhcH/YjgK/YiaL family protein [Candidatus Sodaliphilus aphodohippi]
MITGKINDTAALEAVLPLAGPAMQWLRENMATVHRRSDGDCRYEIVPGKVWANVETPTMKPAEQQVLEIHRDYIDIHVPVDKPEQIGWLPRHKLASVVTPYDANRDIAFYNDEPEARITLHPGEFAVMTPLDAHAPIIGQGQLKKICIKIKL